MSNPLEFTLYMSIGTMCVSALAATRWPAAELVFNAATLLFLAWIAVVVFIIMLSSI